MRGGISNLLEWSTCFNLYVMFDPPFFFPFIRLVEESEDSESTSRKQSRKKKKKKNRDR